MVQYGRGVGDIADVEGAELGIFGTGFVEPHAVDDVFEIFRACGPQRNAPFPIVEAEAGGDKLRDAATEGHARPAMFGHHAVAVVKGECEPIGTGEPHFVHGIEARAGPGGEVRRKALHPHFFFARLVSLQLGHILIAPFDFAFGH